MGNESGIFDRSWMRRTHLLYLTFAVALLGCPSIAGASDAKILRVGSVALTPLVSPTRTAFLKRMAELGYEQGKNFIFEFVQVKGLADFEAAYKEVVARKVDILLAGGNDISLKMAIAAAGDLPVVMVAVDYNPLTRGYVTNLAQPGGNVTGVFFQQIALTRKRLQLMKEAFPKVEAATIFWDRISVDQWRAAQSAAKAMGFPVHGVELRGRPYNYERALAQVAPKYRGALMVLASPVFRLPAREILPNFALRHRMPSMFFVSYYANAGGLMSYGVSFERLFGRAADYVDKIARGAKPANLPIEQPSKFELVVNLKTAKKLGITIPRSILLRADRSIQ